MTPQTTANEARSGMTLSERIRCTANVARTNKSEEAQRLVWCEFHKIADEIAASEPRPAHVTIQFPHPEDVAFVRGNITLHSDEMMCAAGER